MLNLSSKTFDSFCLSNKFLFNFVGFKKKGGALLENLCIVGILLTLIRFSNNQILLIYSRSSSSLCSILLNISIAMYFVSIHPVYLFLWVRQVKINC